MKVETRLIGGRGINPRHVDTILVKNYYELFSENLGIDSTRDRYRESNFSPFASILKKKFLKKIASWEKFAIFLKNFFFWIVAIREQKDYIYLSRVESIPKFSEKKS